MTEMNGIQALLSRLALLPERIASIIEGKNVLELHTRPGQDKWSALFTLRRAELVNVLRRLASEDWQRVGIHEEREPQTLLTIVTMLLEHEEEHCMQLTACFNR